MYIIIIYVKKTDDNTNKIKAASHKKLTMYSKNCFNSLLQIISYL